MKVRVPETYRDTLSQKKICEFSLMVENRLVSQTHSPCGARLRGTYLSPRHEGGRNRRMECLRPACIKGKLALKTPKYLKI